MQFLVTPHCNTAAVSPFSFCNCHLFTLIGLECNTCYYANYYVCKDNDTRTYHSTYYAHVLHFIHTTEHFFWWKDSYVSYLRTWWLLPGMLYIYSLMDHLQGFWRTSATNCSWIFNSGFSNKDICVSLPAVWDHRLVLTVDDIWNGLFIYSLLLDYAECGTILQLDHKAPS